MPSRRPLHLGLQCRELFIWLSVSSLGTVSGLQKASKLPVDCSWIRSGIRLNNFNGFSQLGCVHRTECFDQNHSCPSLFLEFGQHQYLQYYSSYQNCKDDPKASMSLTQQHAEDEPNSPSISCQPCRGIPLRAHHSIAAYEEIAMAFGRRIRITYLQVTP